MSGLAVTLALAGVYAALVVLLVRFLATTAAEVLLCVLLSPLLIPTALVAWIVTAILGQPGDLDHIRYLTRTVMEVAWVVFLAFVIVALLLGAVLLAEIVAAQPKGL